MKTIERIKMKKTLFHISLAIGLFLAAISQSCTKLDEITYSDVTSDVFPKTNEEFLSTMGAAYRSLAGYASGDVFNLQEQTTDEVVTPTRGQDWDDGGNWRRLHLHSWKYEDNATGSAWDFCFNGVATCNRLIYQFQTLQKEGKVTQADADSYVAQLKGVRGFYYWQLVDMYGNVPLVTDFADTTAAPATKSRLEVYNFVVNDLVSILPQLSRTVDGTTYSRMNAYVAWMILAKLYLNAEVYSGTAQLDKAIAACDTIINSGKYSLESNYFANFNVNSQSSKEFIWAIPYDQIYFTGFNLSAQTLHYGSQFTYNLQFQPWNGFCTLEEFYNSYTNDDVRKGDVGTKTTPASKRGNFLAGYQYLAGGGHVIDNGATSPFGKDLNFGNIGDSIGGKPAPQINMLGPNTWREAGVRIGKWEFAIGGTPDMSNDYAIFRYADVLLMKAEALWRKTGSPTNATALALVNQIRERAGVADLTTLDGAISYDLAGGNVPGGELLNEMGREMAFEHNRRTDLIRFGQFSNNAKWTLPDSVAGDVMKSDAYLKLFPINRSKLSANPNLKQNDGY